MRSGYGFEDFLGGASTGAGIGSMLAPGLGTAIGAGAGALMSIGDWIFGDDPEPYRDPYEAQRQGAATTLMNSKVGEQSAANAATKIRRGALDSIEEISNAPGVQGNTGLQSRLYSDAMTKAQGGIVDANIAGAETDLKAYTHGADMLRGLSQDRASIEMYNTARGEMPSYLQSLGQTSLAYTAGKGAENLGNEVKPTVTNEEQTKALRDRPILNYTQPNIQPWQPPTDPDWWGSYLKQGWGGRAIQ